MEITFFFYLMIHELIAFIPGLFAFTATRSESHRGQPQRTIHLRAMTYFLCCYGLHATMSNAVNSTSRRR